MQTTTNPQLGLLDALMARAPTDDFVGQSIKLMEHGLREEFFELDGDKEIGGCLKRFVTVGKKQPAGDRQTAPKRGEQPSIAVVQPCKEHQISNLGQQQSFECVFQRSQNDIAAGC